MLPIIFKIGPLALHSYGLLIAISVYVGIGVTRYFAKKDGYAKPEDDQAIYQLALYFVASGLIGGRLFYVVNFSKYFVHDFWAVFRIWEGGLVSFGGLFGSLIGFGLWMRKHKELPWKKVLDWLAPAMALGHAIGRLGCFAAGCCHGLPTGVPWAVTFSDPESIAPLYLPLHPTQLYSAFLLTLLGGFLWLRTPAKKSDGSIFLTYLSLYSCGRFLIEFLRDEPKIALNLSVGQWVSAALFLLSIVLTQTKIIAKVTSKAQDVETADHH